MIVYLWYVKHLCPVSSVLYTAAAQRTSRQRDNEAVKQLMNAFVLHTSRWVCVLIPENLKSSSLAVVKHVRSISDLNISILREAEIRVSVNSMDINKSEIFPYFVLWDQPFQEEKPAGRVEDQGKLERQVRPRLARDGWKEGQSPFRLRFQLWLLKRWDGMIRKR